MRSSDARTVRGMNVELYDLSNHLFANLSLDGASVVDISHYNCLDDEIFAAIDLTVEENIELFNTRRSTLSLTYGELVTLSLIRTPPTLRCLYYM